MKIMMWIAALMAAASLAHPATAQTAHVKQGALHGMDQDGAAAYLGIPYAAPPVGANRWKAPQPAAATGPLLTPEKYEFYRQMTAAGGSLSMF